MRRRSLIDINLIILTILLAMNVGMFYTTLDGGNINEVKEDFSQDWYYEDGHTVDLENLRLDEEKVSISKIIPNDYTSGNDMCFETSNLFFDVYVDGTLVYHFHPYISRVYGRYYGEYLHTVNLPNCEAGTKVTIEYEPLTNTSWTSFRGMELQEGAAYIKGELSDNFLHFLSSYAVFMIGMFLVVVGLALDKRRYRNLETVSLGVTSIILAIWTSSGSRVLQIITGNSAMVRLMDHSCLLFLPIPVVLFVASVTDMLSSKIVKVLLTLVGLNTALMAICISFNLCDYHDILRVTHIILAIGIVAISYMVSHAVRKNHGFKGSYNYLMLAFGILVLAGIIDLIRYYTGTAKDASFVTRLGMYVFVVVLTIFEIKSFIEVNRKGLEADIKNELAHKDGLTGMKNRLAFNEKEEEIGKIKSGKVALIQLDINFLKKVNDTYGHAEGDRHIIAAATIIEKSFGVYGDCFRTGGDEFLQF